MQYCRNKIRKCVDQISVLLPSFVALSNHGYFDSHNGTGGFGKNKTRRMEYTIRLTPETQHKMHSGPVKMSFRQHNDLLPYLGLYQIASILIYAMKPADLERTRQGELNISLSYEMKRNIEHTMGL
jgi:hypothetical protein